MKDCKVLMILFLLIFGSFAAKSQGEAQNHYVVIGAFKIMNNAVRYTEKASRDGFMAQYAINKDRQLYYVYLLSTDDKRKAYKFTIKMRAETEFKQAWVFTGTLGEETVTVIKEEPIKQEVIKVEPPKDSVKQEVKIEPVIEKIDSSKIEKPIKKPAGKPFYFKFVNSADGSEIKSGDVNIQESIKALQYQVYKGGQVVYLEAPRNQRGSYTVVTQVTGYQPMTTTFDYKSPDAEAGPDGSLVITLGLTKAKRGDYVDFNNVKFFKNTSVLQPESKNELDGLVDLLKEDTKYKIRVHGHCNGTQNRESYTMGTSKDFFAMNPKGNKKETISSKTLSAHRAETVKAYLISEGIAENRISIKGEGGKIPIYPEGGTLGQLNDRVEIEFIKN